MKPKGNVFRVTYDSMVGKKVRRWIRWKRVDEVDEEGKVELLL